MQCIVQILIVICCYYLYNIFISTIDLNSTAHPPFNHKVFLCGVLEFFSLYRSDNKDL